MVVLDLKLVWKVVTVVERKGKIEGIAAVASKLTSMYQYLQTRNVEKENRIYKEIAEMELEA